MLVARHCSSSGESYLALIEPQILYYCFYNFHAEHAAFEEMVLARAMQIARRMKKAIVTLACRLAVILHRIWVDGTEFRWTRQQAAAAG